MEKGQIKFLNTLYVPDKKTILMLDVMQEKINFIKASFSNAFHGHPNKEYEVRIRLNNMHRTMRRKWKLIKCPIYEAKPIERPDTPEEPLSKVMESNSPVL